MFVPVAQLRELAGSSETYLQLRTELQCLVTLDRKAGLYQALSDRLSSASEYQLAELVVRAVQVRRDGVGGLLVSMMSPEQLART